MRLLKSILILLILTNCSIAPPNVEVCGKIPSAGGQCAWTFEGKNRRLSEADWRKWELSPEGMVCTSATAFGELKKIMMKICTKFPEQCTTPKTIESHLDRMIKDIGIEPIVTGETKRKIIKKKNPDFNW